VSKKLKSRKGFRRATRGRKLETVVMDILVQFIMMMMVVVVVV
jgi:hypothetical protein